MKHILQAAKDKGLVVRRLHGVITVKDPDGDSFVPRDVIELQQYVERYKRNVVPVDEPIDVDVNQIIERTPRT